MSIKLYHVSFDLTEPLHKEFIPRIPGNSMKEEDETIPRICLSDSIQGCIRSICGYPKDDSGCACIIVWEHEFQEDNALCSWRYLYENNLVPDAAVTHEYWYTNKITLDGTIYKISNIEYRTLYSFRSTYKEEILDILSAYVDDLTVFENIDPCCIINDWLPRNLPAEMDEIIKQMKEKLTYDEERDEDKSKMEELGRQLWGDDFREITNRIPDYDPTDMIVSCLITPVERCDGE